MAVIQVIDGEIGHVEDFIVDDETWAIRYLVVATRDYAVGMHRHYQLEAIGSRA